jgi:phosphatidylinositol glycan class O
MTAKFIAFFAALHSLYLSLTANVASPTHFSNRHMDAKLNQIDDALHTIFNKIDQANESCQVVFVFGDHGMTEDGNHGGGTSEETNAALFAHYSPGCGDMGPSLDITGSEVGEHSKEAFRSINQIDLVPTISLLLGLPIPYANLGGVVPALLPPLYHKFNHTDRQLVEAPFVATALALNAAQVWNYLATYSTTANKLPEEGMLELKTILDQGTLAFKNALFQQGGYDSIEFREACGHYKYFLSRAIALGKQVWTRFDTSGMLMGILIMFVALLLQIPWLTVTVKNENSVVASKQSGHDSKVLGRKSILESLALVMILLFHCLLLTFSNSYIASEQNIVMFMLSLVCLIPSVFSLLWDIDDHEYPFSTASVLLTIVLSSRTNELFIKGHGLDPMIRKHWAHSCPVFMTSLCILAVMRLLYFSRKKRLQNGFVHVVLDTTAIVSLCISWYEKRSLQVSRHGYLSSRLSLAICFVGFCKCLLDGYHRGVNRSDSAEKNLEIDMHTFNTLLIKVLIFTITVTGPSSASSSILFICQCWAIHHLITLNKNVTKVSLNVENETMCSNLDRSSRKQTKLMHSYPPLHLT